MSNRRENNNIKIKYKSASNIVPSLYTMNQNKTNSDNNEETTTEIDNSKSTKYCMTADRLIQIRKIVEEAIRDKKTFVVRGGFNIIRNALLQRGWIEKIENKPQIKTPSTSNLSSIDDICCNLPSKCDWESNALHAAKCEKMVMSRLLQSHDVDFYWSMRRDTGEWQERLNKSKIINRFSRSLFSSKEGLCLLLQQMYWYNEPGIAYVRFPRCYTINFADHCSTFMEDFRITACISLLKWFMCIFRNKGDSYIYSVTGKVPVSTLRFAIDRCNEYTAVQKHVDIDSEINKIWEHEWDQFLTNFQLLVYEGEKFEAGSGLKHFLDERDASLALKNIIPHWPQYEMDGMKNIWIMKPGNKCRGKDIQLIKDINDVLKVMNHKLKYVIQKYIERPLLIYGKKFDIRQWFMVTCVQPLTIWMYRDCYLRFSSKAFNLENFHESIHLTNHAIQYKYRNDKHADALPEDKMWDNHTFKTYLRQIGQAEKWYKVIYPGMRECIVGAMLASQDTMDRRPNTFELYGADFMIIDDFTPWLIEINSCPAMGPTTSVTARMCPQCFEDIIKVIIDNRRNAKADTGLFELIYRQNIPQMPAYLGMTLAIKGEKLFKRKNISKQKSQKNILVEKEPKKVVDLKPKITDKQNYKGPIIDDLTEEMHNEFEDNQCENKEKPTAIDKLQSSSTSRQSTGVADLQPVTQKAVSLSSKSKINKPIFLDRKASQNKPKKNNSNGIKKSGQGQLHRKRIATKNRNAPVQALSLYDKWKKGFENKITQLKIESNTWEQDTVSILKCKSEFISASRNESTSTATNLLNPSYISSISNILPEIEMKTATSQNLCQNLFTVGLGYKNSYIKPVVKENIILPMNTQQIIEACCLKL